MQPTVRKFLYSLLIAGCAGFALFIFFNGKNKTELPQLKERKGALATAPEWVTTQANYTKLVATLKTKPDDAKTNLQLAKVFMQEGRASGDNSYYNKSALELINGVLAKDPTNFEATCLKAMVFLSQHRFVEGRQVADKAREMNPYNSFVYGLLVDANVETGNYPEAVLVADKMVAIRPDIRSYSRVSYLRELHGDVPGAVAAIKLAVAAGYPGNEDTEWARMVLAHLYEDSDSLELAEAQYHIALQERPDYPFALTGLARIARYKKDYPTAIQYVTKAREVMSDVSFLEESIELYRLNNQPDKAEECAQITLDALDADNITGNKNKDEGHYADMDIANLYLKINQPDKALPFAQTEQQRRPENMDACETLAWALYRNGQAAQAAPYIKTALRTNSQNPERLVRAGLIMQANGEKEAGKALIDKGLALKPYMNEDLVKMAQTGN